LDIIATPFSAEFDSGKLIRARGDRNGKFFKAVKRVKKLEVKTDHHQMLLPFNFVTLNFLTPLT